MKLPSYPPRRRTISLTPQSAQTSVFDNHEGDSLWLMRWRRPLDRFMIVIAGPLGLPYILVMAAIRLQPSLVKYWALGWVKSIQHI